MSHTATVPSRNPAVPSGFEQVQCRATSKATGNQCGRKAEPGQRVCRYHGGATTASRRKAQLRLLDLVDPAVATLARIMADNTASPQARLRAAENVLDRAGVPRTVDVTDSEAARALLIERLIALRESGEAAAHSEPEIVTGEVTDNQPTEEPT